MDSRPGSRASGLCQAQEDIHHVIKMCENEESWLGLGCGLVVKCLPGTHKVLDSIPQGKRKEVKNLPEAVERRQTDFPSDLPGGVRWPHTARLSGLSSTVRLWCFVPGALDHQLVFHLESSQLFCKGGKISELLALASRLQVLAHGFQKVLLSDGQI